MTDVTRIDQESENQTLISRELVRLAEEIETSDRKLEYRSEDFDQFIHESEEGDLIEITKHQSESADPEFSIPNVRPSNESFPINNQRDQKFEEHFATIYDDLDEIDSTYGEELNNLNEEFYGLQDEFDRLERSMEQIEMKIETVSNLAERTERLRENQKEIVGEVTDIQRSLRDDLFVPIGLGIALAGLLASVALVLSRSLMAVPVILVAVLFFSMYYYSEYHND